MKLLKPLKSAQHLAVLALLCALVGSLSGAETNPVNIRADTVEFRNNGELVYEGQVKVMHPNFILLANRVSAILINGKLQEFHATGTPVQVEQHLNNGGVSMQGNAELIEYDNDTNELLFKGDARLIRKDGSLFKSERFKYNTHTQSLSSSSTSEMKFPLNSE